MPEWLTPLLRVLVAMPSFGNCSTRKTSCQRSECLLPGGLRRLVNSVVAGLMALMALFMTVWGAKLVEATWHNTIADFPALSVGVTYLPIPIGGAILLLFVIELAFIGPPPEEEEATPAHPPIVAFE